MEGKKLNLNAPILSVRKISAKNEFRTKKMRNSEFNIPFTWEQTPGKAKIRNMVRNDEKKEDRDDTAGIDESDESVFNFSVSDYSECSSSELLSSKSFPKKEVEEFMMDRFMPAAKAMSSPQEDIPRFKRTAVVSVSKRTNDQELESYIDEEDAYDGRNLFSRTNILDDLLPRFHVEVSDHRSLAQAEPQHLGDEAYKHKLGQEDTYIGHENSDARRIDDISNYHQSPPPPFGKEKRYDNVPKRDFLGRKTLSLDWSEKVRKKHGKVLSLSPSIERTLGSALTIENFSSNLNSLDKFLDTATETGSSTSSSDQSKFEGKSNKFEDLKKYGNSPFISLPLPQSPSESWLKRTLPSVSSKSSSTLSVSNLHVGQSRFA